MTAFSLVFFTFAVKFCLYTVVENPVWITSRTNTCITLFDDYFVRSSYSSCRRGRNASRNRQNGLYGTRYEIFLSETSILFKCVEWKQNTIFFLFRTACWDRNRWLFFQIFRKYYFVKVTEYHYIDFLYHSNYCKLISGSVVQKQWCYRRDQWKRPENECSWR